VSFNVAAGAYDRFMGRYSGLLAPLFADFAAISAGQRVVDVGCGPGALTGELVRRVDPANVSAADPSEPFVAAIRDRYPAVTVQHAPAENLPFSDDSFDAALAQLVVHFMADPVAGLREMSRVTHSGGVVAACVWDHEGGKGPLGLFWDAVSQLDPVARTESGMAGAREGHLVELFGEAGLTDVEGDTLSVSMVHQTFDDWWEPYTLGVGPAGKYVADLEAAHQVELRERCRTMLPEPPFTMTALAWAARGIA
jgi:SAM-dependent methyltransferase